MQSTPTRLAVWSLLLVLGLVVAACGGDGGSNGAAPGGSTDTTTTAASGGGDAEAGAALYAASCSSCHGADAKGVTGLGKDLADSPMLRDLSDAELVAFITVGRGADDPENTTGVAMPPKGGNPALKESDLLDIVAHLHTLSS